MATVKTFPINPTTDLYNVMQAAALNFSSMGYESDLVMFNPQSGMLTIRKDYDDLKKLLGLGYQSKLTFTVYGNQLNVSIDTEWTYVLIALVIGWFIFFVPLITGIIGAITLMGVSDTVTNAVTSALAQTQGGGTPGQNAAYQQPQHQQYQQPQYQQPQYQQPQYQQPQNQQQFQQQQFQQQQFQQMNQQQFQQQMNQQQINEQQFQQQQQHIYQPPMGN